MTYKSCRKGIQNQFGLINNIFDCHQWGEDVKFCRSRTKFIPSPLRKMVFISVWVPSLSQNKGGTNLSFKPSLSRRPCSHVWGNKPLVISHLFLLLFWQICIDFYTYLGILVLRFSITSYFSLFHWFDFISINN